MFIMGITRRKIRPPNIKQTSYETDGGINQIAGSHDIAPGEAIIANNYEIDVYGHYRRIKGYERFDGQNRPSEYLPTGDLDDAAYIADLQAGVIARRALIVAVPGEGRILGVVQYKGIVYAWRNVVGGASAKMWKSSVAGWVEVVTGVTLNPDGEYRFDIKNMDGAGAQGIRLYGVNGVEEGFIFDGTTFTQVTTGSEPAYPFLVKVFKDHLFYAYANGSLQNSALGLPEDWTAINGAAEIGISGEITNLVVPPGGAMVILSQNRADNLYGTSAADWELREYSETIGAKIGSAQVMGDVYYLDDIGVAQLRRVQAFGDFNSAAISQKIQPIIDRARNLLISSSVIKNRNQYRLWFSDGLGISATFSAGKLLGFTTIDLQGKIVRTIHSAEDLSGVDRTYFGSDDGFIYEMDVGTSFDGASIPAVCRLAYNDLGSSEHYKRVIKATAYIAVEGTATIEVSPDFNYASDELPDVISQVYNLVGGGGYYGQAVYGQEVYSAQYISPIEIPVDSTCLNLGFLFVSDEIWDEPHTIKSMNLHYHYRRRNR
jgi:hypothetical protein